jgi:toluene monooxygenase electron transfer component
VNINLVAAGVTHCFESRDGERLLHAGLRQGVVLPYECASGTCGSCKATLVSGEVHDHWPEAPGRKHLRTPAEILLCQYSARTDCAVEVKGRKPAAARGIVPAAGVGVVRDATLLTRDVLAFAVEIDKPMDFDAGQFVGLQFPGIPGFRSYSMVNHEPGATRLEFVIKRKPDGQLTPWLLANEIEGTKVQWFGPLGSATFGANVERDILCIAGGSGIAGMMAILACASRDRHFERFRGFVFFGVRTLQDAFYLAELDRLAGAFPQTLKVTVAVSDGDVPAGGVDRYPSLGFRHGFVHEVARAGMQGKFENVLAYVAGPPPAVDATLRMLILEGKLPATSIRYDKFS